ncbi:type III-A CRISPR-associated RAMP protein Csm3 [Fundicoccus culcitae]|uniref:CRISPR system Cms endoribonuclease Csm3 n=1 Tax=Fundicoccus culcitae TaxID=2969821 RepID=A0ABY5P4Q4_9LACT|nr:type III-A CRISPR-associated RAMP protein Csm3 [Fundicoccus culcitae]UUX33728.1 type III-A CRISPR-associated RAMP protein Csm3 [Fundicoccus culcitae]
MSQYAKIQINGLIELVSGLHIGASDAFSAIGAIDSPVVKDPLTNLPMIPGSSLKGKIRSLLAQAINEYPAKDPNQDHPQIKRLFGATIGGGSDGNDIIPSQLLFRDAFLANREELERRDIFSFTESKFENSINRYTGEAKPRQIERVIKGSKFDFNLIYEVRDQANLQTDFETIVNGLRLLEWDYLGGSGSRGYGQIRFENIKATVVYGEMDLSELNTLLEERL